MVRLCTPILLAWTKKAQIPLNDAEDLIQEVFLILLNKLPLFQRQRAGSFRKWLQTITANKWQEWHRKKSLKIAGNGSDIDRVADPATNFWEEDYRIHLVAHVMPLIKSDYDPLSWQAFMEHKVQRRPAAEVANQLGLTEGAVRAAAFRIRDRIRKEIADMLE